MWLSGVPAANFAETDALLLCLLRDLTPVKTCRMPDK